MKHLNYRFGRYRRGVGIYKWEKYFPRKSGQFKLDEMVSGIPVFEDVLKGENMGQIGRMH